MTERSFPALCKHRFPIHTTFGCREVVPIVRSVSIFRGARSAAQASQCEKPFVVSDKWLWGERQEFQQRLPI